MTLQLNEKVRRKERRKDRRYRRKERRETKRKRRKRDTTETPSRPWDSLIFRHEPKVTSLY